jgi:ribosomal protein L40E
MIICQQCGERNGDGSKFCGACDAFLDWEGTSAGPPAPPSAPPEGPGPLVHPPPRVRPSPAPAQVFQVPQVAQPTDEQPRAPRSRKPEVTERRPPAPGELICGQCGAGNAPTRKFCHSCGSSLQDAPVVADPWWRKLIPRRRRKVYEAGSRPGRDGVRSRTGRARPVARRIWRWVRNVIALILVCLGLLYGVVPSFRTLVNQQIFGVQKGIEHGLGINPVPVRPTSATSPTQLPDHQAPLAVDTFVNTYWAAPAGPAEPVLVLHFGAAVDIRQAIIRIGIDQNFQSSARPQRLHLVYSTGNSYDIDLADTPDAQTVEVKNGAGATDVEVHVVATYKSLTGTDVAISEMEFFQPR